jgi:hypothetical protein
MNRGQIRFGRRLHVSGKFAHSVPLGPALGCSQPLHLLRMYELTVILSEPTLTVRRRADTSRRYTNHENQDQEIHQAAHRVFYLERDVTHTLIEQLGCQSAIIEFLGGVLYFA